MDKEKMDEKTLFFKKRFNHYG